MKIELGFDSQRSRAADQRLSSSQSSFCGWSERSPSSPSQARSISDARLSSCFRIQAALARCKSRCDECRRSSKLFVHGACACVRAGGNIQEIIGRTRAHSRGEFGEIGVHGEQTAAQTGRSAAVSRRRQNITAPNDRRGPDRAVRAISISRRSDGAAQDVSDIAGGEHYAFGFARCAGGVDDCDRVGVGKLCGCAILRTLQSAAKISSKQRLRRTHPASC